MSQAGKFECQGCQRAYTWKPELAGKKVRCKCGQVMVAPDSPPLSEAEPEPQISESTYDLASDPAPPLPKPVLARPTLAAAPVAPVAAAAIPQTLGYARKSPVVASKEAEDANAALKQLTIPIILTVIGLGLMFTHSLLRFDVGAPTALVITGVSMFVNMLFIAIGCLIAIKVLDISLGAPAEALLKLCAVSLLPGAISGLIEWKLGPVGGMVGWMIALACYYALLAYFFDLDTTEVMILTVIIWLVRTWIGYVVLAVLLSMILGGGNWSTGGNPMAMFFGGDGADEIRIDSSPAGRNNGFANALLLRADAQDASEFVKANNIDCIIGFDNPQSRKMVQDLLDAGAKEVSVSQVYVFGEKRQADKVIVVLPKDQTKREALIAMFHDHLDPKEAGAPTDLGKEMYYMTLNFDGAPD